jgi:hypothetical protein
MKKLILERVVPTMPASVSWLILGMTVWGAPSFPKSANKSSTRASLFSLELNIAGEDQEETVLKLHYIQFTLGRGGALVSSLSLCPGEGCAHGVVRLVAPPTRDPDLRADPVHWAGSYVQAQIDRGLPTIGGPLQLVKITHQGLNWIDLPLVCSK